MQTLESIQPPDANDPETKGGVRRLAARIRENRVLSVLSFLLAPAAAALVVVAFDNGDAAMTAKHAEARRHLQLGRPQEALDVLAAGQTTPLLPEGNYLKAVALDRLKMKDAALDAIRTAVAEDPENPKYRGLELRMQLFEDSGPAADEILELYSQNSASAALALFAFYAHQARRMQFLQESQAAEANAEHARSLPALEAAATLAGEIPEFQRELLTFSMQFGLADQARHLVDRLVLLDPANEDFAKHKIAVLLLQKKPAEALEAARAFYEQAGRTEQAALTYSAVLNRITIQEERLAELRELAADHPQNLTLMQRLGSYLARAGHVDEACALLDDAIGRAEDEATRWELVNTAVYIPLEAGRGELAGSQLERYRSHVRDDVLLNYFEGRVLYLNGRKEEALAKLSQVGAGTADAFGGQGLAVEAAIWMQKIKSEMEGSTDKTSASARPVTPKPSPTPVLPGVEQ